MPKKPKSPKKTHPPEDTATIQVEGSPNSPHSNPEEPESEDGQRTITIALESFQNVEPCYPISNVFVTAHFLDQSLGESEKVLVAKNDPVVITAHEFTIAASVTSASRLNAVTSFPVVFTLMQSPGAEGSAVDLVDGREELDDGPSLESVISLYEALTGDVVEEIKTKKAGKSNGKKGKKGSKGSMSSKASRKSSASGGSKKSPTKKMSKTTTKSSKKSKNKSKSSLTASSKAQGDQITMGVCVLDLLPLLLGHDTYSEFLPMGPLRECRDDKMATFKTIPGISVTVTTDERFEFACSSDILSLTVESIFNIPSLMVPEMDYQISILLPSVNSPQDQILLSNGRYTTLEPQTKKKKWPDFGQGVEVANTTSYRVEDGDDGLIHELGGGLAKAFDLGRPRIEFNVLKRNLLLKDGRFTLVDIAKKYGKLLLEIFATPKGAKLDPSEKCIGSLHLMALVDISSLLHPGLTKLRIATPLTTFHPQEAARFAGFTTSFFCPEKTLPKAKAEGSPKPPKTGENKGSKGGKKGKSEKGKKKGGKSSKKSSGSSTSVKGQKKKKEGNVEDLNEKLKKNVPQEVPPEPKPEPSVVVYSNEGEKTFIVIELELIHPLVEKRKLEELHEDLIVVVGSKPIEPRMVRDLELIEDFSKEILQNLIRDVYERYHEYIVAKSKCGCGDKADFLTYLRRTGIFQSYTYSIINVTAMKIQSCPNLDNTKEGFVEEIFVYLVKKVREILHKQVGLKPPECRAVTSSEMLLSFAKEAKEIGDEAMAERYHLQRMAMDDSDPDPWFDYAVFMAELGEHPKAFACIQNVLGRDMYHKNGLLMNAIYLRDRGQRDAAETCFLTLVVQEPTWVEAWGVVYLFYEKDHDLGGMQLAKEMALKYLELNIEGSIINELTWTSAVLPNTMFFRAAAHLVKLRNFDWAEMALSHELYHAGYVHYLLAVISYYRQCYQHCLSHLQEAKHHCGYHHTITSLTGHCYLALGNSRKAHNEYLQILESFQRPTEMMHLFYLNCARALEALDSPNEARKLMLMACKSEPSPYIWSHCGLMYLQMNDLISAEECFSEATMLDNRLPDVWAQLSLINLKLDNLNEATLCYSLARKNGLNRSSKLGEEIEARLKKLGSEPC